MTPAPPPAPTVDEHRLPPSLMALLAITVFVTAGTIHFQTPMLAEFAREFGADTDSVGWVATLSFGGFLIGTLFLAPLGDRYDKRGLILGKLVLLAAAVLAMGAAPNLGFLTGAAFLTGIFAGVSQHIIPMVAELAAPGVRGRAVGTVLSGLFLGVLFGRVIGGQVASLFGWRWMYGVSAVMILAVIPVLVARLPRLPAKTTLSYGALMASLGRLLASRVDLRRASAIQFLLGICYGGFWATLAPMMAALHGLGPAAAGLIGIPGAAGILVARPAGRWMDRSGVGPVVTTGVAFIVAAYVTFGFAAATVIAVVIGAALQDIGLRAAMVANQALVTGTDPDSRSRSNTIFAVSVWGGNATGAFVATTLFTHAGWLAVCASGVAAASAALAVHLLARRG